jgi:probable lipoprotein NlpC
MKETVFSGLNGIAGLFCISWLMLASYGVFAAPPIRDNSLHGVSAFEARSRLIAAADSFLGVPYRYGGIDQRGLDCSGLVYLSFHEGLRISIPRTAESIYAWTEKIETSELSPGDLVFFVTAGTRISHLGIYAGEGRFIHSASEGTRTGVLYSRLDEAYWRRTYVGAGRALPLDERAARAAAPARTDAARPEGSGPEGNSGNDGTKPVWADSGFFVGFGAAWTWGGYFEGSPSLFRGISTMATVGYKWSDYRIALELRPEWDGAYGVSRFPFVLSFGTDIFKGFVGPVFTFGEPSLSLQNGERHYSEEGSWLWEIGFSAAFPPIKIDRGALSFYGELAWQSYRWAEGDFDYKPSLAANLRLSTGIRYLWRL